MATTIKTKRAYVQPEPSDGYRILVDRLWPRGLCHEKLDCQEWDKDIAPSNELREWFHEDQANRWHEFGIRYKQELNGNPHTGDFIQAVESHPVVTLVYGAHDEARNNAAVLKDYLENHLRKNWPK